ncbi:hypothetical protein ACVPPR_04635 [Dellaglioa sp. L3N]
MIDLHEINCLERTAEVAIGKGTVSVALRMLEELAHRDYEIKNLKIILNLNNKKSAQVAKRNDYRFVEKSGQNLYFEKELGKS